MGALKATAFIVGLLLLGATAHVTIAHTGGYGTPHSILTIAIAAGVGIGALCIGAAWATCRKGVARWLVTAILAGEAFGFLMTAERLVTARDAIQAPIRAAQEAFDKARDRVMGAASDLVSAPTTSPRLTAAETAKASADAAVVAKSAERGCLENCRKLLQAQVDAAAAEVEQARSEIAAERQRREIELTEARVALEKIEPPASAAPLADRIGIPAWALDLITAAVGSMAANGLACGLIAFAAHHRREDLIEMTGAELVVEPAPVMLPTEHAAQFAVEALQPAKGKRLDLMTVHAAYGAWCARKGIQPLSANQIGAALAQLFEGAGISVAERQGRFIAIGVSLARGSESKALTLRASSCGLRWQTSASDRAKIRTERKAGKLTAWSCAESVDATHLAGGKPQTSHSRHLSPSLERQPP
jgi:hypothetical protein